MRFGNNRIILVALAALMVFLGGLQAAMADDSPQPEVVVVESEHNAGEVPKGSVIFHQFELQNKGQAPLLVDKVVAGCGCTAVDWDKEIAPGQAGYIIMTVEVEAEAQAGPLSERVLVKTNDPKAKVFPLYITAQVTE